MLLTHSPNQNHLIAALPATDFERIAAHLELVEMSLGEYLYEPDEQLRHAYFPTTAIVSLHYVTESGASAETAGVGNEGVVGIALFMGGDTTPTVQPWCKLPVTLTASKAACSKRNSTGPD